MNGSKAYPIRGGAIAILFAFISAVAVGCSSGEAAEADAGSGVVTVEVETIERETISRVLSYSGDILGEVEVRVFSTIPERIVALNAEEGQQVERGDLLATIRADALGQGVRQALGGLASARAQVAGLRDTLNRQQRLAASGVVTQAQVDATRFQLQAAEAQMAQLQATVGSARSKRSDANVRSPIGGIIGQVFVEEGDLATPQRPICTVVQMDRVEVVIQVPEQDLGSVHAGMEAEVRIASVPERVFRAPVSRISPVVDRMSRTATLRIMLDNPDHVIRPGSLADVSIEVERHDNAVVVNQYSLVLDERAGDDGRAHFRAYVLSSEGESVEERRVETGIFAGDRVEVTEGLDDGERLVVQGQHLLRADSRVRVATEDDDEEEEGEDGQESGSPDAGSEG